MLCVRLVSFIGYLCLLLDEGKSASLALSLQRLEVKTCTLNSHLSIAVCLLQFVTQGR